MIKYATFQGKTGAGNPLIHLVEPGSTYGMDKTAGLEKTASKEHLPDVLELLESIAPQPGRLYLVNSALGAGEYVGFNLRGDWFTEAGLRREPEGWSDIPVWDIDARRKCANKVDYVPGYGHLTWGYPTFYNAHRFRHHVNKDPNKAYGFILGAFWDDRMKRVILVSELVEEMCRNLGAMDIYKRIENGEFPDSSMGSKVPYDRCSICGNKAKSPMNYCHHVGKHATHPYGMKQLLPDGRRCGVYNDYPRFFDDSFVFTGAERSAKVMADVTPMVRGDNPYSQKIYPFSKPVVSLKMAQAPEEAAAPARNADFQQNLDAAVRHIPMSSPQEKSALKYFANDMLAKHKVETGEISQTEYSYMDTLLREKFFSEVGSPIDNFSQMQDQLQTALDGLNTPFLAKQAGHSKWAELFKQVPADPKYLSIVRSQTKGFRPIDKEVLDRLAEDPRQSFGAAAKMGIVLTPKEFQYAMLKNTDPDMADALHRDNVIFRSMPITDAPNFPMPEKIPHSIQKLLSSLLENRSFSPKAIRIRITKVTPAQEEPLMQERAHPLLDSIGSLYNSYRVGLLPNIRKMSTPMLKYANFYNIEKEESLLKEAQQLSTTFFYTAYWPSIQNSLNYT